jgi:hypothetical protein
MSLGARLQGDVTHITLENEQPGVYRCAPVTCVGTVPCRSW